MKRMQAAAFILLLVALLVLCVQLTADAQAETDPQEKMCWDPVPEANEPIKRIPEPEETQTEEVILTRERDERPEDTEEDTDAFTPYDIPLPEDLQRYAKDLCEEYGVELPVFLAIMEAESGFNPEAVSETDDYGLMQINAICAEYLRQNAGVTDLLDPRQNMKAAAFLLGDLYAKHGDTHLVLMCYQYGEGGAAGLWREGIYTSYYSNVITEKRQKY